MRSSATRLTAGLTAATALVLLTACGGSDDGAAGAAASADPAVETFCADAERVLGQVGTSLDTADPDALVPALDRAVADLSAVQAPAEIGPDWEAAKQLFAGVRDAVAGEDLTTPGGQAAVQAEVTRLEAAAGDSQTRLDDWTSRNCNA
jgi:hypothetical protein